MIIAQTDRLFIQKLSPDDAVFILKLLNTAAWLKFIGDRNVRSEEDAKNFIINGPMKSYQDTGFGFYKTVLKEDNTIIGICGLVKRSTLEHPDVGFAFLEDYEGKGYAYESASAVLELAKNIFGIKTIAAITTTNNNRSIALLKKLGLTFQRMVRLPNDQVELMLFETQL